MSAAGKAGDEPWLARRLLLSKEEIYRLTQKVRCSG